MSLAGLNQRMEVQRGDITRVHVDAIVNAANSTLMGGGGVDGALHRAAGPALHEECRTLIARIGFCPTGKAEITGAGNLPAKFVIHAVGPVYSTGKRGEPELLASAYRNSLVLAAENKCRSIAFPNISTGAYGFPKAEAALISVRTVKEFLSNNKLPEKVIFCCFGEDNYRMLAAELMKLTLT